MAGRYIHGLENLDKKAKKVFQKFDKEGPLKQIEARLKVFSRKCRRSTFESNFEANAAPLVKSASAEDLLSGSLKPTTPRRTLKRSVKSAPPKPAAPPSKPTTHTRQFLSKESRPCSSPSATMNNTSQNKVPTGQPRPKTTAGTKSAQLPLSPAPSSRSGFMKLRLSGDLKRMLQNLEERQKKTIKPARSTPQLWSSDDWDLADSEGDNSKCNENTPSVIKPVAKPRTSILGRGSKDSTQSDGVRARTNTPTTPKEGGEEGKSMVDSSGLESGLESVPLCISDAHRGHQVMSSRTPHQQNPADPDKDAPDTVPVKFTNVELVKRSCDTTSDDSSVHKLNGYRIRKVLRKLAGFNRPIANLSVEKKDGKEEWDEVTYEDILEIRAPVSTASDIRAPDHALQQQALRQHLYIVHPSTVKQSAPPSSSLAGLSSSSALSPSAPGFTLEKIPTAAPPSSPHKHALGRLYPSPSPPKSAPPYHIRTPVIPEEVQQNIVRHVSVPSYACADDLNVQSAKRRVIMGDPPEPPATAPAAMQRPERIPSARHPPPVTPLHKTSASTGASISRAGREGPRGFVCDVISPAVTRREGGYFPAGRLSGSPVGARREVVLASRQSARLTSAARSERADGDTTGRGEPRPPAPTPLGRRQFSNDQYSQYARTPTRTHNFINDNNNNNGEIRHSDVADECNADGEDNVPGKEEAEANLVSSTATWLDSQRVSVSIPTAGRAMSTSTGTDHAASMSDFEEYENLLEDLEEDGEEDMEGEDGGIRIGDGHEDGMRLATKQGSVGLSPTRPPRTLNSSLSRPVTSGDGRISEVDDPTPVKMMENQSSMERMTALKELIQNDLNRTKEETELYVKKLAAKKHAVTFAFLQDDTTTDDDSSRSASSLGGESGKVAILQNGENAQGNVRKWTIIDGGL